jgi:S-adenosylmethionine-diacylglycerol 3-amino-3-carboxypropyl transferase
VTKTNFSGLNYTLANEDSSLEYAVLKPNLVHIVSIAGSGSRVIPLIARNPQSLTCVDISFEQLSLAELRFESIRAFDYEEFLEFWGYSQATPQRRQVLFKKIQTLQPKTRTYFEDLFHRLNWDSLLYQGKWERRFLSFSRWARRFVMKNPKALFNCQSLDQQKDYLRHKFPLKRWHLYLFLYGQFLEIVFKMKPSLFPKRNSKKTFFQIYKQGY